MARPPDARWGARGEGSGRGYSLAGIGIGIDSSTGSDTDSYKGENAERLTTYDLRLTKLRSEFVEELEHLIDLGTRPTRRNGDLAGG